MKPADRATRLGLRALNEFAGSQVVDRIGLRKPAERLLHRAARGSARTAAAAGRRFRAVRRLSAPARLATVKRGDLFDLDPTDEQRLLAESLRDFARERIRPAALAADAACAAPAELLAELEQLGIGMLGVPEELGGVVGERSSVTTVLAAEALAHGDAGIAVAALAPHAVSTAIALWGTAEQQARYLHEFTGERPPAAALALLEPRALFDPFKLEASARRADGGYIVSATKSLVPRAAEAELFVVAAELADSGPALFLVEPGIDGVFTEPEPAMGLRAAATGRLVLRDALLPAGALLGGGERAAYAECVHRARLGWCALALGAAQAVLDYVVPYVKEHPVERWYRDLRAVGLMEGALLV